MGYRDYNDRIGQLIELASYDDSADYETDIGGIYLDPSNLKIVFISASGCSCWDGGYEESSFDSLAAVEVALLQGDKDGNDVVSYQPSLMRCRDILEEAKRKLPASWIKEANEAKAKLPKRIVTVGDMRRVLRDRDDSEELRIWDDQEDVYRNAFESNENTFYLG